MNQTALNFFTTENDGRYRWKLIVGIHDMAIGRFDCSTKGYKNSRLCQIRNTLGIQKTSFRASDCLVRVDGSTRRGSSHEFS